MSTSTKLPEYGLEFSFSKSWILENLHRAEVGYYYQEIKYTPAANDTVQLKLNSIVLSYSL